MKDDFDLNLLQKNILHIAKYFHEFCEKHKIQYYLLGGTALGAVRHKGFIPWDDDFDVCMDHYNYENFLKVASEHFENESFYFQKENTIEWPLYFSKIRMNNTLYLEEDVKDRDMHHGIYIDVMCLNNTFSNDYLRYTQYIAARLLSASALGRRGYCSGSAKKQILARISAIVLIKPVRKLLLAYVRLLNKGNKRTLLISHFAGRARFKNTCFPSEWLGEERLVPFEECSFPVMSRTEEYLRSRFGKNFMRLPTEEVKAQYPNHCVEYKLASMYENVDPEK